MKQQCIQAVSQAIGRSITQKEAQDIETRVKKAKAEVARQDPAQWRKLTERQRLGLAADYAGKQLQAEAAKVKQRVALTVLAHEKNMSRYNGLVGEGHRPFKAIAKILDDADTYAKGVAKEYYTDLLDTLQSVDSRFLGMIEDAKQAADLVKEIFGEDSGNPIAKKGAKAWMETVEAMRQRFNSGGGDIGRLDYGYMPQPHDSTRVIKASMDKWVKDIMPTLDRRRYVDQDGNLLNDAQMIDMLQHAYETISENGVNKIQPGKPSGNGMRANKGSDHRVLHFNGAEGYLKYHAQYGRNGIMEAMQGHVQRLSKDIAMVEEFGPNPNTQFNFMHDTATKTGDADRIWVAGATINTREMWSVLNGNSGHAVDVRLADIAQGARNIEVFSKLGSAFVSSITDIPTYFFTTGFHKIGFGDSLRNLISTFGDESQEYANRAGFIAESLIGDMNRFAETNMGNGITSKLSAATMRLSLLNAWTDGVRRAFSLSMAGAMGKIVKSDWSALHADDMARLTAHGVTDTDFNIWKLAKTEQWRNSDMLTLQSLRNISDADLQMAGFTARDRQTAISRYLGLIVDESEYASVSPDLRTRTLTGSGQKGTLGGEFRRTIFLFKSFPIAMISRHWGRALDKWEAGNKISSVAYGAGLSTALTIFGAMVIEAKDIMNGKDPRDRDNAKFWAAAFAQGGGSGIIGDLIYTGLGGNDRFGKPNWMNLLGPVFGDLFDISNITLGNIREKAQGKETHMPAELMKFGTSHLPFINLWYAKSAIDHAALQDINDYLSPGYLARMQQRAMEEYRQQYWWKPGKLEPSRAPKF